MYDSCPASPHIALSRHDRWTGHSFRTTLELEITVDDPKVYTRPWTVKMIQGIELDTELIDEFCLENEKSYERIQAVRPKK
jgi:hypothetical protein